MRRRFPSRAARLVFSLAALALLMARAGAEPSCPAPGDDDTGTARSAPLRLSGKPVTAWACLVPAPEGVRVLVELHGTDRAALRWLSPPGDVEGRVTALHFDKADYPLSPTGLTLPLRLETDASLSTEVRRVTLLWLLHSEGPALARVFEATAALSTTGRGCENDCPADESSDAIFIVKPGAGHAGLRDLRVRQRHGTSDPVTGRRTAADRETLDFVFDGTHYQPRP